MFLEQRNESHLYAYRWSVAEGWQVMSEDVLDALREQREGGRKRKSGRDFLTSLSHS